MKKIAAALSLVATLPAFARGQGLYLESVGVEKGEDPAVVAADPTRVQKSYAVPGKYRMDARGGKVSIFRFDRKTMYLVDPSLKTYSETKFDDLKSQLQAVSEAADAAQAEMQKELAKLTPEQRKLVEEQMRGAFPKPKPTEKPIEARATGETKTICGYACRRFLMKDGDEEVLSAWVTNDIPEMKAMRKDWEQMLDATAAMTAKYGNRSAEAYRKLEGFPLETEQSGVHTVTTKVERVAIPDSQFEVPEGYSLEPSPLSAVPSPKFPSGAGVGPRKVAPKIAVPPEGVPPAPKAAAKFCSNCGAKLDATARFCTSCGKKVGG